MIMLTDADKTWLAENYPELAVTATELAGVIRFSAYYNEKTNRFVNLRNAADVGDGIRLDGDFKVRIQPRTEKTFSRLPALHVEGVEQSVDRHINQTDQSACLCSPLEEDVYLVSELQFRRYLDELVIPFLFGQAFYTAYGRWPWLEYSHGPLGLLESYSLKPDPTKARECMEKLQRYQSEWLTISSLLKMQMIKGHTPCLCRARDHMRRCHPTALSGIRLLSADLREQGIPL